MRGRQVRSPSGTARGSSDSRVEGEAPAASAAVSTTGFSALPAWRRAWLTRSKPPAVPSRPPSQA
ncbi:MAG TPA: hypothetical protein VHM02_15470, partial [Thermoanaerobaculia bacterium]|nr:hypothetical protein [Thermoanaerobaculia bacterium]